MTLRMTTCAHIVQYIDVLVRESNARTDDGNGCEMMAFSSIDSLDVKIDPGWLFWPQENKKEEEREEKELNDRFALGWA